MNEIQYTLLPLAILLAFVAAPFAFVLDGKLKRVGPGFKHYRWGYFQGVIGILWGLVLGLACVAFVTDGDLGLAGASAGVAAIWILGGLGVLKRRRWGWVVHTVTSLNPAWWIINPIYAARRWPEFAKSSQVSRSFGPPALSSRPSLYLSHGRFAVLIVSALVVAAFLFWKYAATPDAVAAAHADFARRMEQTDSYIADYQRQIDSIKAESVSWLLAEPAPGSYAAEEVQRLRQHRQDLERRVQMWQEHMINSYPATQAEVRTLERRRSWYFAGFVTILAVVAVSAWIRFK